MAATWTEKVRESLGLGPGESRYSPVNQDGSSEGQHNIATSRRRPLIKIAAAVGLTFIFLYLLYKSGIATSQQYGDPSHDTNPVKSNFFHLVIPASSAGFCRTLFSAGALNYPTPRIINYKKDFNDNEKLDGGFHLAKIEGVNDFLQKLDGSHHHELVYIPDGLDTWFQLRPEVLINRYNAVRKRLEQRTWPRYGLKYDQTIMFSAQKRCDSGDDSFPCLLAPPSDVPADVYGNDNTTARPRYLNSGSIMGNVGALKTLFQHAKWKTEVRKYSSDQEVFSEIFGDQEYYREMMLANEPPAGSSPGTNDPRNGKVTGEKIKLPCEACQFGIGLDYWGELSAAVEDAKDDLVPVNLAETLSHRDLDLPADIEDSTPPFWTPDYSGSTQGQLPQKSWTEVSLQTNQFTGVRPVTLHHGAAPEQDVADSWRQNWNFPYLRTLVSAHAKSMRIPFAVITDDEGQVREYWGPNDGFGGARVHKTEGLPGDWRQWDELCGGKEIGDSVFADGRGPYQCPVYYLYWEAGKQHEQIKMWQDRMDEAEKAEKAAKQG